jgi:hypothetical protein
MTTHYTCEPAPFDWLCTLITAHWPWARVLFVISAEWHPVERSRLSITARVTSKDGFPDEEVLTRRVGDQRTLVFTIVVPSTRAFEKGGM